MPDNDICRTTKKRSDLAKTISELMEEIEEDKKGMEEHRRKFHELQSSVVKKMEETARLESEFMKSITSKLTFLIHNNLRFLLL